MKKLLITAMALSCFALSYGQKKVEKQIIGKWCNPYTYKSTGELKGFEFKKGGKCSAINIPSLDLKTWKVDNGYLIVEGFSNGSRFWTGSGQKGEWDDARKDENRREDAVEYDDAGI